MDPVDIKTIVRCFLVTFVISFWLLWLWRRREWYKFTWRYSGYWGLPLIGAFYEIKLKRFLYAIGKMFEDYKRHTICTWWGLYPIVITKDPELIKQILTSPDLLNKARNIYTPIHKIFNGGIATSPADEWAKHRKMINPIFNLKVLLSYFPIFNAYKDLAVTELNDLVGSGEKRLFTTFRRYTMISSFETTMGTERVADKKLAEDLLEKVTFVTGRLITEISLYFLNMEWIFKYYKKYQYSIQFVRNFTNEVTKRKYILMQNKNSETIKENDDIDEVAIRKKPNIFIEQAIKTYQNGAFTWNDLLSESFTLISGSYETTAIEIYSTLVMLAMHPEVQECLFNEVHSIFPDKQFEVKYSQLSHLPYMDMIINETLRLVPPFPIIGRQVDKELQIDENTVFPKDLQLLISIFHLHRCRDIWGQNAHKFNPNNFLPDNFSKIHPYGYIPFSKGARNCIGWHYGLIVIKVMLAALVRNFRFTTNFKYEDLEFDISMKIKYRREPALEIHRRGF